MKNSPIGIFDSGYGGLTVLKDVVTQLPDYDYIYLGDNARAPYGTRSFDVVYEYTRGAVVKLFEMGCRLVILACNTASAKALRTIQQKDLPLLGPERRVLGVIRPSVEKLGEFSGNNHIGILATNGTVSSGSYPLETEKLYGKGFFTVTQQACPMLAPLVENNELEGEGVEFFVRKYMDELFNKDPHIDTIVLGCTHYPLLKKVFARNLPDYVKLVDQGSIVAASLKDYLGRHPEIENTLSRNGVRDFYTTEKAGLFESMAEIFMEKKISAKEIKL